MAEDSMVLEVAKLGQAFMAAASVLKTAKELQTQIAGYEIQVGRLRETLITERKALETARAETKEADTRLQVAEEKAGRAEAERDRRLSIVAQEEEAALGQFRAGLDRQREQIARDLEAVVTEAESKKRALRADIDLARQQAQRDLDTLLVDIETAKARLQQLKQGHAKFVEAISQPALEGA